MQKKRILLIVVLVAFLVWAFAMLNRPPVVPTTPDDPANETETEALQSPAEAETRFSGNTPLPHLPS